MGAEQSSELETVLQVDLNKYLGKWYELAKIPSFFEKKDGRNTTAEYKLKDGIIQVVNSTVENGVVHKIKGKAYPIDSSNSKLKVDFGLPSGPGDYWILQLAENYQWAVVSEPSKSFLWILSRDKHMNYDWILNLLKDDFDLNLLVKTEQD
jgi:apolipoprotein D and lipocalin family protein